MLTALSHSQELIVDKLWEVGAIKIDISPDGGFRIKAQDDDPTIPNSPFYLNIRTEDHPSNPGPVTAEIMDLVGNELFWAIGSNQQYLNFGWFADIPDAGTPFGDQIERVIGEYVSGQFGRLKLCKLKFEDGSRQISSDVRIMYGEPAVGQEDTVLLVDDLITRASTKLEAIRALEGAGFTVVTVLVLFDRGRGVEELRKLGYNVVAVMSVLDVVDYLLAARKITDEEHRVIREYITR